jgi:uncharacterized protein (DUF1810 family)
MFEHFVEAQAPVYDAVVAELGSGRKRSHWMWFVFPQLAGLGSSPMAQRFALASLEEARAYLAHDVLGPRLVGCTRLVLAVEGCTAHEIFGSPDDRKFGSSMTLFARAAPAETVFRQAIDRYYGGIEDARTLTLLGE